MAFFLSNFWIPPFQTDSHPCIRIGGPVACIGGPVACQPAIGPHYKSMKPETEIIYVWTSEIDGLTD